MPKVSVTEPSHCVLVELMNERPWVVPARTLAEAASKVPCYPGQIRRMTWLDKPVRVFGPDDEVPLSAKAEDDDEW